MSYASLTEKIKSLPENCLDDAEKYIEQLLIKFKTNPKNDNNIVGKPKGLEELADGELDKKLDDSFEELKAGKFLPFAEGMKNIRAL